MVRPRVFKTNTHNVQDTIQNVRNAKRKCDKFQGKKQLTDANPEMIHML